MCIIDVKKRRQILSGFHFISFLGVPQTVHRVSHLNSTDYSLQIKSYTRSQTSAVTSVWYSALFGARL